MSKTMYINGPDGSTYEISSIGVRAMDTRADAVAVSSRTLSSKLQDRSFEAGAYAFWGE